MKSRRHRLDALDVAVRESTRLVSERGQFRDAIVRHRCPPLAQNQQHAEPRPGERVVLWCLYDPDANEAKPWRVQWKEGGERMGTRKGRDDVRVKT